MEKHVDILILGAGCAGLTAGLYAARAGAGVLILEKGLPGGQAALTASIENYPGLPVTDGVSLMQQLTAQAQNSGAVLLCADVLRVEPSEKRVWIEGGVFSADALILATGAVPRRLGIPGEAEFWGRGVSCCASCDGFFYRDRDIYVVGGGNSAGEEALHLAELGRSVTLLVRRDALRCDAAIAKRVLSHPKIRVRYQTELAEIRGGEQIETLVLRHTQTGLLETIFSPGCGVFLFIGYQPASELFAGKVALDEQGYVETDENLCTSLPGVFAAGDVRRKRLRQLVTAAADGAVAGFQACQFLSGML